jgi:hypothetical protein
MRLIGDCVILRRIWLQATILEYFGRFLARNTITIRADRRRVLTGAAKKWHNM